MSPENFRDIMRCTCLLCRRKISATLCVARVYLVFFYQRFHRSLRTFDFHHSRKYQIVLVYHLQITSKVTPAFSVAPLPMHDFCMILPKLGPEVRTYTEISRDRLRNLKNRKHFINGNLSSF